MRAGFWIETYNAGKRNNGRKSHLGVCVFFLDHQQPLKNLR